MTSPVVNIGDLPLESWERGTLYAGADVRIGPMIGVKDLGISYSEVPPGKSGCPFHNHHVEDEMFIVLEGEGTYRFGTESYLEGSVPLHTLPADNDNRSPTANTPYGTCAGKVSIIKSENMDHDPLWNPPIPAEYWARDLEVFPRDEVFIPDWLRAKLADAGDEEQKA